MWMDQRERSRGTQNGDIRVREKRRAFLQVEKQISSGKEWMGVAAGELGQWLVMAIYASRVLEWTVGEVEAGLGVGWGDYWKHKSNFSGIEEVCQGGRTNRKTEGQKDKSSLDLPCLSLPMTSASPWTPGVSSYLQSSTQEAEAGGLM